MKLYEIKIEYLNALNNIEVDENGEVLNLDEIQKLSGEFNEKAEAIACFIKEEESMVDALEKEIKALQDRKSIHTKKVERLTNYLSESMIESNKLKIETSKVRLSFRKSASVNVIDPSVVPEWYRKEVTEIKVDKKQIGEVFKSGGEVPGCEYITKQNLQIK